MVTERTPAQRRGRAGLLIAPALIAAAALPSPARAEDGPLALCRSAERAAAMFDLQSLFGEDFDELLQNGMQHTIVARVQLRDSAGSKKVLAMGIRTFVVRWFIWEEFFKIEISDDAGRTFKKARDLPSLRGLLKRRAPLQLYGERDLPAGREVAAELVIDLDPMDKNQLKKLRRRLANPRDRGPSSGQGGSSLFGTMSGLFIDQSKFRSRRSVTIRIKDPVKPSQLAACPAAPPAR